jgi:hypothetical protein
MVKNDVGKVLDTVIHFHFWYITSAHRNTVNTIVAFMNGCTPSTLYGGSEGA